MKNKRIYLEAAIILIMLFIGYWFWPKSQTRQPGVPKGANVTQDNSEATLLLTPDTTANPAGTADAQASGGGANQTPPPGSPPSRPGTGTSDWHNGMTFEEAMKIFASSGYRYQLSDCHGNPGRLAIKQGVYLMLDNRDGASRTVKVGNNVYRLGNYDFAIIPATDIGTYHITCEGGGAAEIMVQR